MTVALEASEIRHAVGGEDRPLLDDVSLMIPAGSFVSITGRSGSGKSTLLAILGLLLRPDRGTVAVGGSTTSPLSDAGLAKLRGRSIGFVFQNYSLVRSMSVWQNVALPLLSNREHSLRDHKDAARAALGLVGLEGRADALPHHLSGGEQQRAAIARALIRGPAVILADEPTGSLDVATGDTVLELLIERVTCSSTALVLVTHDRHVAGRADLRLELHDGRLSA